LLCFWLIFDIFLREMHLVDENYAHDKLDYLKFVINYHVFIVIDYVLCICELRIVFAKV